MYDTKHMDENFDTLIKTDTYLKTFISKVNIPIYKDGKLMATVRNNKDIALYDYDDFIENNKYYFNNFETVRLNHISKLTVDKVAKDIKDGLDVKIASKTRLVHLLKYLDGEVLEFRGKENRVERWNRNHYDKSGLEILSEYKKLDDVIEMLDFWGKNKLREGGMAFHGYDKNFFNQYYQDTKTKLGDNFIPLFFYDKDKLIGLTTMERTADNFWIIHSRKCDRFTYSNLNLYIDIYTYRKIWELYNIPFYVNIGYESGKRCEYKAKRFPTHSEFKSFHLKFEPKSTNTVNTLINI